MGEVPSLLSLCTEAAAKELIRGDDIVSDIYELPPDLFDSLLPRLPPVALQKLQEELSFRSCNDHESTDDCFRNGRKRGRYGNFNTAWKTLFKSRWPKLVKPIEPVNWLAERVEKYELTSDWQQMYWETHIQDCIDEAAEIALLPSFDGCIGEIKISDAIIKYIGCEGHTSHSTCDYPKLSYHCQQFGYYARSLRLQNVFCIAKTCHLLSSSKLESLVVRRIKSKEHVDGLCKLLRQNSETLRSLEFVHCKLSTTFVSEICESLHMTGLQTHRIEHFSVKASRFLETNPISLPVGLVSFLSSRRSLRSLTFCDNRLGKNFAKMVFNTLLDASSNLSILDLSENNISGWLSNFNWTSSSCPLASLRVGKSLQSLHVLNLRGNNLCKGDVDCLKYALVHIPNLKNLDISDNPIEDDGIRSLIPYIVEASERHSLLSDLKLENCELSCNGVTQLLEILSTLKKPLDSLSIADNGLGRRVAAPLGKFLCTSIRVLNIESIGMGSSGFLELEQEIEEDMKLVRINLSKNCGGIATAKFLSKLISRAPELVAINAAYNFIPADSLVVICSALKVAKGKLEHLDLTGNNCCEERAHASMVAEFQRNGRPIVIFPSLPLNAPHDDDP
ncbi:hypothetical protein L1049_004340 [Liquidambar formosana]|uniref:Uncharacterized protein n=1 Tax=Liquidambar formosana TaxID=63359 RepID=A0AAP0X0Q7_LIQFO